jgi:hypothetical protein
MYMGLPLQRTDSGSFHIFMADHIPHFPMETGSLICSGIGFLLLADSGN